MTSGTWFSIARALQSVSFPPQIGMRMISAPRCGQLARDLRDRRRPSRSSCRPCRSRCRRRDTRCPARARRRSRSRGRQILRYLPTSLPSRSIRTDVLYAALPSRSSSPATMYVLCLRRELAEELGRRPRDRLGGGEVVAAAADQRHRFRQADDVGLRRAGFVDVLGEAVEVFLRGLQPARAMVDRRDLHLARRRRAPAVELRVAQLHFPVRRPAQPQLDLRLLRLGRDFEGRVDLPPPVGVGGGGGRRRRARCCRSPCRSRRARRCRRRCCATSSRCWSRGSAR